MSFQVGSKVRLRSGGPNMTVEAVSADSVTCVWFDKSTPRARTFPAAALEDADRVLGELLEDIAREREDQAMSELSIVALRTAHPCAAGILPPGTIGTIVHVYRDAAGYEVEFSYRPD